MELESDGGYQLLENNRAEEVIKVFTTTPEALPDSPNVNDAREDAYEKAAIKPGQSARPKLTGWKAINL